MLEAVTTSSISVPPACVTSMQQVPTRLQTGDGMNPTHLIPITASCSWHRDPLTLSGLPYARWLPRLRHVDDLASAHVAAIDTMTESGEFGTYNLGNGNGYSVKEVIAACEKPGSEIPFTIGPCRERPCNPGCKLEKRTTAGWKPAHDSIEDCAERLELECYRRDCSFTASLGLNCCRRRQNQNTTTAVAHDLR